MEAEAPGPSICGGSPQTSASYAFGSSNLLSHHSGRCRHTSNLITALPLPPRHFIPLMSNTCPNFYHTSNFRYIIRPPFRLMDDINFMFLCSLLKSPIPLPLLSPFFSYLPAFCSSIPCDTPLKVLSTRNHQLQ